MKFALHFGNNTFSDPEGASQIATIRPETIWAPIRELVMGG